MVLLLASCQSDLALRSERIGPGHYRLVVDRCHVIDQEQLEAARAACSANACATARFVPRSAAGRGRPLPGTNPR